MNKHVTLGDDIDPSEIDEVACKMYYILHDMSDSFLPAFDECNSAYRDQWRALARLAIWHRIYPE